MKSLKLLLASAFLCLCMTTSGFSLTIVDDLSTTADDPYLSNLSVDPNVGTAVGGIDTWVATTTLSNSNTKTETDWVNSILTSEIVTYSIKEESDIPIFLTSDDSGSVYAVNMPTPPVSEYFLVKNVTFWALFANVAEFDWGVFDTSLLPGDMNVPREELTVSHVTRFDSEGGGGGGGDPVPEPATMMLLGFGLLGVAGVSRKRMS